MKGRAIAALLAAVVAAGGATLYYVRRPAPEVAPPDQHAEVTAGATEATPDDGLVVVEATPLPAAFQSKGVAGRRFGVLRVYVSAAPEVALRSESDGRVLQAVPVLVTLENDSYRELDARRDLGLDGDELFAVEIRGPASSVVFTDTVRAEDNVWRPAERKSFDIRWRPQSPAPGEYVITVKPAFDGAGEVQLHTRLK